MTSPTPPPPRPLPLAVPHRLELLAPAGDPESLQAALEAGADAVYLGLTSLNARRRARNFQPAELAAAVRLCHVRGTKVYLTVNTDLTERELGQAARLLALARELGVDAVIVRDAALFELRVACPDLEYHFSTQAGATNSADVRAAVELGISRVILARELTLAEIATLSAVPGAATEVFVQGALCFGVSGRCLLSSWGGGRSGNRGTCTSPCRVPWSVGGQVAGTPLSMADLSAVDRVAELGAAGVTALKIEGRLKAAAWVRAAVTLFRRALAGEAPATLRAAAAGLGAYTGRRLTSAYLDGERAGLTGTWGRDRTPASALPGPEEAPAAAPAGYALTLELTARGVACRATCGAATDEWTLPRTVPRQRRYAPETIAGLFARLQAQPIQELTLGQGTAAAPATELAPATVRRIEARLSAFLHGARRRPPLEVRCELPAAVAARLAKAPAHPANTRQLGDAPDRVRVAAPQVAALAGVAATLIVEDASAATVPELAAALGPARLIVALPAVLFEAELPAVRELLAACQCQGLRVEVNSWGGWLLARDAGVPLEGGPGLAVLNTLAAAALGKLGVQSVTLSPEADRDQLAALLAGCPLPGALLVYGRPVLVVSRAQLPATQYDREFVDRRGIRMIPRRERGLTVFRPVTPFTLTGLRQPPLRVAHLVADLVAAPDPAAEWRQLGQAGAAPFRFNYERGLA